MEFSGVKKVSHIFFMDTETLFNSTHIICSSTDQGEKTIGICIFNGIEVLGDFTVGPITLRPLKDTDKFPEHIRKDTQYAVLEIRYIDRKEAISMYAEPMFVQEAAIKTFQLMVNGWAGASVMYHFRETGEKVGGTSGSSRWETADTEFVREGAVLEVNEENKEKFKTIFYSCFGSLKHVIDRFNKACSEIKDESILDFVISLEGTLGYGLETEISHRLSSRGSFLLSENLSEREHYYQLFKTLYKVRSTIAHGGVIAARELRKEKFVTAITTLGYWPENWLEEAEVFLIRNTADIARQVTRQVILKFIGDGNLLDTDNLLKLELGTYSKEE